MKTEVFRCDGVGCNKEASQDHQRRNWLEVSMVCQEFDHFSLKLNGPHCFCSIKCLAIWAVEAAKVQAELRTVNDEMETHKGGLGSSKLPNVTV